MPQVPGMMASAVADGGLGKPREALPPPGSGLPTLRLTPAPDVRLYNLPAASGQRPAASGQRPAASGQRPSITCARREAGAHRQAPSAGSPSRPDPRPGRRRPHFSRPFPVLALLLGTLGLFAAAPAAAQVSGITVSAVAADNTETAVTYSPTLDASGTRYTATLPLGTANIKFTVNCTVVGTANPQVYYFSSQATCSSRSGISRAVMASGGSITSGRRLTTILFPENPSAVTPTSSRNQGMSSYE